MGLTHNNFFLPFPVLVILPYLLNGQVSLDAIQNYRAIEAAYAREVIRPTGISTPFDSQITFVQQVTISTTSILNANFGETISTTSILNANSGELFAQIFLYSSKY